MKIMINYDLVDKARQAKDGFSLKKQSKAVGTCMAFVSPLLVVDATVGGKTPFEMVGRVGFLLLYYYFFFRLSQKARSSITKERAEDELRQLSYKLKEICVETDAELLQDVSCYKKKYNVNTDSWIPKIEEKKYLRVPVHSDRGNNSRYLVQEHTLGSKEYSLSHGEPEEKKVYSLGTKKMMQK